MVQRNISIRQAFKEEGKKGLRHGNIEVLLSLGGQKKGKKQLARNIQRQIELRRGLKPQRLCRLKGRVVAER